MSNLPEKKAGCLGCKHDNIPRSLCTHPDADKKEFWSAPDDECYTRGHEVEIEGDGNGIDF